MSSISLAKGPMAHGGKLPKREDERNISVTDFQATAAADLAVPSQWSWSGDITAWGMMLNDRIGDCTFAAAGHEVMMWTADAGGPEVTPSDQDILTGYSAVSGYDPATGANDNGCVELDVLNYWRQTGIAGHQIGAYAEVKDLRNHKLVRKSAYQFEGLYIGVQLPKSVEGASTWRVPYYGPWGDGEPGSWGGHAVPVVAFDRKGLWVVTWGELLHMTWAFWNVYVDEAYAIVAQDQMNGGGISPLGLDIDALERLLSNAAATPRAA
jgi:hypothetical protein